MPSRNRLSLTGLAALVALALPAAAGAAAPRTAVAVGLGDQSPAMFTQAPYKALKLKKTRYFVRWDVMEHADALATADQFVAAATKAHVSVLLHVSTNDFTEKKAKLPSLASYKRDVGALVRHFKAAGVRDFGTWNEENHTSQPTWSNPKRAAEYYRAMRTLCSGCTIVALDVLDQAGVTTYIKRFFAALPKSYRSKKIIIGIHDYSDTNRKRSSGTRSIIDTTKKYDRHAEFWFTETGGVVSFGKSFPCSTTRAASRITYMFSLAKKFRHDVKRLYAYNWTGTNCKSRFDAGLTQANGTPRAGYTSFKKGLVHFER